MAHSSRMHAQEGTHLHDICSPSTATKDIWPTTCSKLFRGGYQNPMGVTPASQACCYPHTPTHPRQACCYPHTPTPTYKQLGFAPCWLNKQLGFALCWINKQLGFAPAENKVKIRCTLPYKPELCPRVAPRWLQPRALRARCDFCRFLLVNQYSKP